MGGAGGMFCLMLIVALLDRYHPAPNWPPNTPAPPIDRWGSARIAMIYLEAAVYNCSWGPMTW
jgi:hypothetical protein